MDFDKRTILAFLLIGAVLILMNTDFYQKMVDPKGFELRQQRRQQVEQKTDEPTRSNTVAEQPEAIPNVKSNSGSLLVASKELEETKITVSTKLYEAVLSTRGGAIKQWLLLQYSGQDGTPVELFPKDVFGSLILSFNTKQGDSLSTGDYIFDYNGKDHYRLNGDSLRLTFTLDLGENRSITKNYVFIDGQYDVGFSVEFNKLDDIIADKQYYLHAPNGLASTEANLRDDMTYAKAGICAKGNVRKDFKSNRTYKEPAEYDWVAVRNKYFSFYILPQPKSLYAEIIGQEFSVGKSSKDKWKKFSLKIAFPYLGGNNVSEHFTLYLGPLEYDILKSYRKDMQGFMDWGMSVIKPFSIGILMVFKWMHNFIPNYGVVLLIFAVLIKLITYPLTQKSNQSMKKMQALQPKMKELQEKYKSDPQKLNQMTMRLYKEEGVNPMGGCLPMLLQMPLLFALFMVFRTTIELRGQGFFWWIKDLSVPDTIFTFPGNFSLPLYGNSINILPILMGITMFIQQKMTVTDPKQKMMVYFMPIFFTLLFNNFPSGLNLYYALFNLLSIAQQKYFTPQTEMQPVVAKKKRR